VEGRSDIVAVLIWGFAVAHLTIASVWLGSMSYSLTVVQPKVDGFFGDGARREEFLTTLAQGNRWKVVGLIAGIVGTGLVVALGTPHRSVAMGFAIALALYLCAAAIFANVSWRHWPARVFARPEEVPRFQRSLRAKARVMVVLVGVAFVVALGVTAATGVR
jgi:hypothetical protein